MHDIVRDYVINQHSDEELRSLQKTAVDAILVARPEQGFPIAEATGANTFEGYVARQLYYHIRGSIEEDLDDLPGSLMAHPDTAVKACLANAVGFVQLLTLSQARDAAGALADQEERKYGGYGGSEFEL